MGKASDSLYLATNNWGGKKEKSTHLKMFMKHRLSRIKERSFEMLFSFSIVDGKMCL